LGEGQTERFRKLKTISVPKTLTLLFLCCSLVLSASIFVRFFFTVDSVFRFSSIITYLLMFLILPIFALAYIINEAYNRRQWYWIGCSVAILSIIFVLGFLRIPFPEYSEYWLPVPFMLFLYAQWNPKSRLRKKKYGAFVVSVLTIVVLLPNMVAAVSVNILLHNTATIDNNLEKANLICTRVEGMTNFGAAFRANADIWKFWLTGTGCCGEMTMAKINLLTSAGFEARKVFISGENHEFPEVKINGEWMVADGATLITREQMTLNRINGIGSLTYVVTLTDDSFTELTQTYVPNADTITIQVLKNGQPVPDANVQLQHTFVMGSESIIQTLPYSKMAFHTDDNGTVTLHLGKPVYIGIYQETEPYYWIYVNGKNQSRTVTSTGASLIQQPMKIDIG
jgi:hypothetical protein